MRVDRYAQDHQLIAVGTAAGVVVAVLSFLSLRKASAPAVSSEDVAAAAAAAVASALASAGIAVGAGNLSGSGVIGTGGGAVAGGAGTGDHSATGSTQAQAAMPAPTASIELSAPTTFWSRTNAGYIGARKTAGAAGLTFPVDVVTVPQDPATGTGGVFYRLLTGANAGWLVSASDPSIRRVS